MTTKHDLQLSIAKKLSAELSRITWNKIKTINSYSIEKSEKKITFKVEFYMPSPYSDKSSLLIILRNNGVIQKWSKMWDEKAAEADSIDLFKDKDLIEFDEKDGKIIVKQLLKEII